MVMMSEPDSGESVHFTAQQPRRQSPRIPGPFEGRLVGDSAVAVNVRDLNTAGCFVDAAGSEIPIAMAMRLHIELPVEGWIAANAETVYRLGRHGVAMKFVDLDEQTRDRITREVARALEQARL